MDDLLSISQIPAAYHIWVRAAAAIVAILILFGAGDCVRYAIRLGRSRIVRTDRPQPRVLPADSPWQPDYTRRIHVLPFQRRRLDDIDAAWQRLQHRGLALDSDAGDARS